MIIFRKFPDYRLLFLAKINTAAVAILNVIKMARVRIGFSLEIAILYRKCC